MAEITGPDLAARVAAAIPGFFNDAKDQFALGEGAYLAIGEPQGPVAQIGQAIGRSYCRQYGANPGAIAASNGGRTEQACRPYLNTLNPGGGVQLDLPFTGGQCTGVAYRLVGTIQFDVLVCSTGQVFPSDPIEVSTEIQFIGPIVSVSPEYSGVSPCGPNQVVFRVVHDGGAQSTTTFFRNSATNSIQNAKFSGSATDATASEGECGFPDPVIRQPIPTPDPTGPSFRFNPDAGVDVGVNVEVNPDGSITFDFGGDSTTVDPFNPTPTGGDGDGDGPSTPGSPGQSGDTGSGGGAEGEAEEGGELVGVLVEVLQAPQNPNIFSNNSAQVFRGVGYVRMGFPNRLGTDVSGGTVISPQFFHAQQRGLTSWAVRANTGFNLRTTPYYRTS